MDDEAEDASQDPELRQQVDIVDGLLGCSVAQRADHDVEGIHEAEKGAIEILSKSFFVFG